MPSPVGHTLASVAIGWALNRPARSLRVLVVQVVTLAAIGVAPDLDLLWGRHSRETHSIGAAVIVAGIAAWGRWPVGATTRVGIFTTALFAYFIHPVMDTLSMDDNPPVGVTLWWPFSTQFVHSEYAFFDPISRYWHEPWTWPHNFMAAGHEVMWIGPVVLLAWWVRRNRS